MDTGGETEHDQYSSHQCPPGIRLRTDLPKCLCGIGISGQDCSATVFDTNGIQYRQVCGKIIGYQDQTPDAFGQAQLPVSIDIVPMLKVSALPMAAILANMSGLLQQGLMKLAECIQNSTVLALLDN